MANAKAEYQPSAVRSFVLQAFRYVMTWMGNLLALFGWRPFSSFDVPSMKKEASALAEGLTDCGDQQLTPILDKVFDSIRNEKDLTMFGRWFLHHHWVENVFRFRLLLTRDYEQYPQHANVPIQRPIFVIGNPRTGSTFFHFLLNCDPFAYSPPLWQSGLPSPPPLHNGCYDKRVDIVRSEMNLFFDIAPLIRAMHPIDIELPHECYHFFDRTYLDSQWHVRCQSNKFFNEYENLTVTQVAAHYDDYKKQMQLLAMNHPGFQGEKPFHYIMKDPNPLHDYFPEALVNTFPDANLIEVHRNPADSLLSYLLLESSVAKLLYGDNYDLKAFGQRMIKTYITRRERIDKFKATFPKERFLDLTYNELLEDPIGTVKRAYSHFGYKFTQEFEDNLKTYIEKNHQYKLGNYQNLLSYEDYGLSRQQIEETFSEYIAKYNLNAPRKRKMNRDSGF